MVADVHRTLMYGGIYMYPADKAKVKYETCFFCCCCYFGLVLSFSWNNRIGFMMHSDVVWYLLVIFFFSFFVEIEHWVPEHFPLLLHAHSSLYYTHELLVTGQWQAACIVWGFSHGDADRAGRRQCQVQTVFCTLFVYALHLCQYMWIIFCAEWCCSVLLSIQSTNSFVFSYQFNIVVMMHLFYLQLQYGNVPRQDHPHLGPGAHLCAREVPCAHRLHQRRPQSHQLLQLKRVSDYGQLLIPCVFYLLNNK